jgi:hypothetical protein
MIDDTDEEIAYDDAAGAESMDAAELFSTGAFRIESVAPSPGWTSSPWMLVVMIAIVCIVVSAWLFVVLPVMADLFFYANPWLMAPATPF